MGEVAGRLARIVSGDKAAEWDQTGLVLGDPGAPVTRVGVCHEATEHVVERVEEEPVELLVAYHPLLFHPTRRLVAGTSPAGRAYRLARAGVALAIAHTAFDVAPGGVADALARVFDLVEVTGFGAMVPAGQVKVVTFVTGEAVEEVAGAMAAAGAGTIGDYTACSFRTAGLGAFTPGARSAPAVGEVGAANREPEVRLEMIAPAVRMEEVVAALVAAHPYEEPAFDVYDVRANLGLAGRIGTLPAAGSLADLATLAVERLGGEGLRVSGDRSAPVRRVAVVPGSGGSFAAAARALGADAIVTGDVAHHRVVEALDSGLAVVDPGHAPTERPGMGRLVALVAEIGPPVVDLTGIDPTPWRSAR